MLKGQNKSGTPGFRYVGKTKTAVFSIVLPGSTKRRKKKLVGEVVRDGKHIPLTRDVALDEWKRFRDEVLHPRQIEVPRTFRWYIETYWTAIRSRASESTAETDEQVIRSRLMPYFADVELERINLALVRDFVGQMKRDGYSHEVTYQLRGRPHTRVIKGRYSPATINGTLQVLRKILKDAEAREVIDRYPIRGRLPREKEAPLMLELTAEEKQRFLAAFDDEWAFRSHVDATRAAGKPLPGNAGKHAVHVAGAGRRGDSEWTGHAFERFHVAKPLFIVALDTGLSRTDLLNLKWSDVDDERQVVRLYRQKTKVLAAIPISTACSAALETCRDRHPEFVFVTPELKPYSVSTFLRYFATAKALAGIERRFRPHDLRHTFGSDLATEGVPISDIAVAMGHTSERMAARYSRSAPSATLDRLRAALDRRGMSPRMSPAAPAATDPDSSEPVTDSVAGEYMERATRVELATSSLGSWRSTN